MLCVQGGDLTSLQELMLRHERGLYGFFARYTGDRHLAEDLFQDCFVRLVRGRSAFDASRGFRPWLYSVAANLARDACRRRSVRSRDLKPAREGVRREPVRPDQEAERLEEAAAAREALDGLPEDARMMAMLHFLQGLTYAEVAGALEVPVGTVKSRIHWTVRKLAQALEERAAAASSASSRRRAGRSGGT
jgi:RNA polymerase sigma-70 factor (ECF subfamily)